VDAERFATNAAACEKESDLTLLWQADFLAQCLKPRIAAQQAGTFTIRTEREPADPNRPKYGHAIQSFEDPVFIA
jgi:hypothetical protein